MITLADTLPPLAILAAVAALGLQARAISALRASIEEMKEAQRPAPAPTLRPGRPSAPTFGGMYEARPNPVAQLSGIPGGAPLVVAGLIGLAGLLVALMGSGAAATPAADPAPIAGLQQRLDSLTGAVRTMQDSLRLFRSAPPAIASRQAPARRETQQAAVIPPPPAILPAPALAPIGTVTP